MKIPKTIRGIEIIKILTKKGFVIKSRKSSYVTLSNGKVHMTIVMPITTIGVFLKICKITGISPEEFL